MPSKHHADLYDPEACASTLPDCITQPSSKKLYDTVVIVCLYIVVEVDIHNS